MSQREQDLETHLKELLKFFEWHALTRLDNGDGTDRPLLTAVDNLRIKKAKECLEKKS